MQSSLVVLVALFSLLSSVNCAGSGSGRSYAELFDGAFFFVNSSQIVDGVWVNTGIGKIGNIMYAPAYKGALYGNMSVAYGNVVLPNATCNEALTRFSAYTGGYRVFPEQGYVEHYPLVTSNPISGHTPANEVARRFFNFYNNDNLLSVATTPASYIFWGRNFPYTSSPTCLLTGSVTAQGASWVADGASHQVYTLTISNVGDRAVTSAQVQLNLGPGVTVESSWGLTLVSGTVYSVNVYGGLAAGQTLSSSGFIARGFGSVSVAVPPETVVCN